MKFFLADPAKNLKKDVLPETNLWSFCDLWNGKRKIAFRQWCHKVTGRVLVCIHSQASLGQE